MSIRLPLPLDPARTDADWLQDFTFFVRQADVDAPENWAGDEATLALVPRQQAAAAAAFVLSSATGGLVMLPNGCAIRLPWSTMADRRVGLYDFELRQHRADGAVLARLVGSVAIELGLSTVAVDGLTAAPSLSGAISGTLKIVTATNGVRVIATGVGPQGPPGAAQASAVGFEDLLTQLGASEVQGALVALWEQAVAPQDDFSLSHSSGLGSYLGVF